VHIDFGFFLSNAPGKGIELEKNCPFKLMSNYVEVLGGVNSLLFMEFRSLFEDEIITLVKMMYSSHGESMPCFQKGSIAITEL
jgi:phosphatidylinositol kinase/protein kinase (PI-3  family)